MHLPCRQCQSACLSPLPISTCIHTTNNNAPDYMQYDCIIYEVQWMLRGLGMCLGHRKTFFLCVPKVCHTAIIIYNALTNQSAPPLCLPESDLVHLPCRQCQSASLCLVYISTCIHTSNNDAPNYVQYYCIVYEVR